MIALLLTIAQLYANEPSIGFARGEAKAPPLPIGAKSKFSVSIFNGTKLPITVLSERCSWGYEMVTFEVTDPAHHSYLITRKPKVWNKNVPDPVVIPSAGLIVKKIDFSDGTWEGFPSGIAGSAFGWKIRVKMSIAEDLLVKKDKFWIGKIESRFTEAKLAD